LRDLEGRGLIWAVKGKKIEVREEEKKKKKIPFCRGVSFLFGKSVLRGKNQYLKFKNRCSLMYM
jgi:hypothetical protein